MPMLITEGRPHLPPWAFHPPLIGTHPASMGRSWEGLGDPETPSPGVGLPPRGLWRGCAGQPAGCLLGGRGHGRPSKALPLPVPQPAAGFAGSRAASPPQCGPGLLTPRFMEFELEEEMQIQKLQWVKVAQGLPPPAPPKPEPRGPPAPEAGPQPGTAPMFHGSWWPVAVGTEGRLLSPYGSSPSSGHWSFDQNSHQEPGASAALCQDRC